jgi:hypothetical protein
MMSSLIGGRQPKGGKAGGLEATPAAKQVASKKIVRFWK